MNKTRLIEELAKKIGQGRAEKVAELFVTTCCGGMDPEDGDAFAREDIAEAFKNNVPARDALLGVLCAGEKDKDKGRKFKPGRSYSSLELASFYPHEKGNEHYRAACEKVTKEAWIVAPEGVYNEAASAKYLGWYADGIPRVPTTIEVNGTPVAPVRFGEDQKPREFWVDPFAVRDFLDPEMRSPSTDASFQGYSPEALSAMRFWYTLEGCTESLRGLREFADRQRGKGPAEILTGSLLAKWNKLEPQNRPRSKAPLRPFVEPIAPQAPSDGLVAAPPNRRTPVFFVVGQREEESAFETMREHMAPLIDQGLFCLRSMQDMAPGSPVARWVAENLASADAVLLLCSSSTLALAKGLQGYTKPILPIELSPCGWQGYLGNLRSMPFGKPIRSWGDKDEAWMQIAQTVKELAARLSQQ